MLVTSVNPGRIWGPKYIHRFNYLGFWPALPHLIINSLLQLTQTTLQKRPLLSAATKTEPVIKSQLWHHKNLCNVISKKWMQALEGISCSQFTAQKYLTIGWCSFELSHHSTLVPERNSSFPSLGCAEVVPPQPLHPAVLPLAGTQFSESLALVHLALAQWLSFLKSSVVLPLLLPLCLKIANRALHPVERMTLLLN